MICKFVVGQQFATSPSCLLFLLQNLSPGAPPSLLPTSHLCRCCFFHTPCQMYDSYVTAMDKDDAYYHGGQHHWAAPLRRESQFPIQQAVAPMPSRNRYRDVQSRVPDDIEDDGAFYEEEGIQYDSFGMRQDSLCQRRSSNTSQTALYCSSRCLTASKRLRRAEGDCHLLQGLQGSSTMTYLRSRKRHAGLTAKYITT